MSDEKRSRRQRSPPPDVGGLRGRKRDVPADVNAFWQNQRPARRCCA